MLVFVVKVSMEEPLKLMVEAYSHVAVKAGPQQLRCNSDIACIASGSAIQIKAHSTTPRI
jgi:hypothetical protein